MTTQAMHWDSLRLWTGTLAHDIDVTLNDDIKYPMTRMLTFCIYILVPKITMMFTKPRKGSSVPSWVTVVDAEPGTQAHGLPSSVFET